MKIRCANVVGNSNTIPHASYHNLTAIIIEQSLGDPWMEFIAGQRWVFIGNVRIEFKIHPNTPGHFGFINTADLFN